LASKIAATFRQYGFALSADSEPITVRARIGARVGVGYVVATSNAEHSESVSNQANGGTKNEAT